MAQSDGVSFFSTSHPTRRSAVGFLAALPLVGKWISPASGMKLNPDLIKTVEIEIPTYAEAGDVVTCENGHAICEFVEAVAYGQMQDVDRQLGEWKQEKPLVGQLPLPVCVQCGAPFTDGMRYHFGDGWRGYENSGLRIAKRSA